MRKRVSDKRAFFQHTKAGRPGMFLAALAAMLVLSLGMIAAPFVGKQTVYAAESAGAADEYTYTVRILGGAQGKVTGGPASANGVSPAVSGNDIVYTGLKKGDRITFDTSMVSVNNPEKYRATEIRLSGRDNQDLTASVQSFSVTEDRDCVVAYNVRSANELSYTIYYRDTAGNNIADPVTLHGNAGETMVVGAKWSDTHFPNAYNREIEFGNGDSYTFTYQPNPTPTPAPTAAPIQQTVVNPAATVPITGTGTTGTGTTGTGTTGTDTTGTGTAGTGQTDTENAGTAGGTGEAAAGAAGQTGTAGTGAQGTAEGASGGTGTEGTTPANPAEVPEILDINDVEVPLANAPGAGNETGNGTSVSDGSKPGSGSNTTGSGNTTDIGGGKLGGLSTAVKAGIGIGIAAVIAVIVALLVNLKKRK